MDAEIEIRFRWSDWAGWVPLYGGRGVRTLEALLQVGMMLDMLSTLLDDEAWERVR